MWSSGVTTDFWTYTSLAAGQRIEWTERWYPASGLEGIRTANEHGVLWLTETWEGVTVEAAVTAVTPGTLQILADGALVAEWPVQFSPGPAWNLLWQREQGVNGAISIRLLDAQNNVLIETSQPPLSTHYSSSVVDMVIFVNMVILC